METIDLAAKFIIWERIIGWSVAVVGLIDYGVIAWLDRPRKTKG